MSRSRNTHQGSSDAPVVNPFDRFTQVDFDDYVGGLRNKIRDALDPRRGLRNRDRDSDASFGLGYGEFKMGRSVSVGETSFATSGQSVPRSSVEGELGEQIIQHSDGEEDPESDTSDHDENNRSSSKLAIVVSGAGDEESPYVISDDEDEGDTPAPAIPPEVLTPRTKAHQFLGLQEEEERDNEDDEDEEETTSSPSRPAAGPMNRYEDIDDVQLVEDSSAEEDAGDDNVDSAYDEQGETFEGSLPAWPLRADVEENIDDSHVQDSMHSLDEFFVADMPQDFDSNSYTYNTSDPEMQEISGNPITNSFSQILAPGLATTPSFSNEAFLQIFPTQESHTLPWPAGSFSTGQVSNGPHFSQDVATVEGSSHTSAPREDSRRISWPTLSGFGGGNINMFDAIGYAPQSAPPLEPAFYFDAPEDASPHAAITSVPDGGLALFEQPSTSHEFIPPDVAEEPEEIAVPQASEDIGSAITPSLTPPLSPSGVTLTAPDPSLLSDNSSAGTSIPVAVGAPLEADRRIGSQELVDNAEDLTLPEEVTQELNRDAEQLPDPHQVPEPTSLGFPEGVAGLATRIIEPSMWAEPPTPLRSENADDAASRPEAEELSDELEMPELPPQSEYIAELRPETFHSPSRVRWRDQYASDALSLETPKEELETLERGLLQPTPTEGPAETPQDELTLLESSLTLPTPTQTPLETPREELDILAQRLVVPTPALETPQADLRTLEQSLLTGISEGSTPFGRPGQLTRDSTMTDATWSQGPLDSTLLRHATSATLTGDSYFPSQPMSSLGRETPEAQTQDTLDGTETNSRKPSSTMGHSFAHSSTPFSDGSSLSEDDGEEPSVSKQLRRAKRKSHPSRSTSSVKHVGMRELKALQDTGTAAAGSRLRRTLSKPAIQTTSKGPTSIKGKQKSSPSSKKGLSNIVTSPRVRSLRSNSQVSSAVSKRRSPGSTVDHEDDSDESSRDEIDLLERVNEEAQERDDSSTKGSELGDRHPLHKRKRVARISMPGDDEDYLPDDMERSIKKRKVEAKEHDLDHSLDTIDLASALETAESIDPAQHAKKPKKSKAKKPKRVLPEEPVEADSSSEDLSDQASEFVPSPVIEKVAKSPSDTKEPDEVLGPALDAEAYNRLSPAAQAKFRRLNPESRAYKPTESESESSDSEAEVTQEQLARDLKGIVDVDISDERSVKGSGSQSSKQEPGLKPKPTKTKRSGGGGRKSKKAKPAVVVAGDGMAADGLPVVEKVDDAVEELGGRDVEMEVEENSNDAGFVPTVVVEPAAAESAPMESITSAGATITSTWGNPLSWWRKSPSPNVAAGTSSGRNASPASDKMDTD